MPFVVGPYGPTRKGGRVYRGTLALPSSGAGSSEVRGRIDLWWHENFTKIEATVREMNGLLEDGLLRIAPQGDKPDQHHRGVGYELLVGEVPFRGPGLVVWGTPRLEDVASWNTFLGSRPPYPGQPPKEARLMVQDAPSWVVYATSTPKEVTVLGEVFARFGESLGVHETLRRIEAVRYQLRVGIDIAPSKRSTPAYHVCVAGLPKGCNATCLGEENLRAAIRRAERLRLALAASPGVALTRFERNLDYLG